jgi:hypothetical protein
MRTSERAILDDASFGIQYLNVALHTERGAHDRVSNSVKHCIVLGAAGSAREPKSSVLVKHLSEFKITSRPHSVWSAFLQQDARKSRSLEVSRHGMALLQPQKASLSISRGTNSTLSHRTSKTNEDHCCQIPSHGDPREIAADTSGT